MRSMSGTSESKVLNLAVMQSSASRARASLDVVEFPFRMLALLEVFIFQTLINFVLEIFILNISWSVSESRINLYIH